MRTFVALAACGLSADAFLMKKQKLMAPTPKTCATAINALLQANTAWVADDYLSTAGAADAGKLAAVSNSTINVGEKVCTDVVAADACGAKDGNAVPAMDPSNDGEAIKFSSTQVLLKTAPATAAGAPEQLAFAKAFIVAAFGTGAACDRAAPAPQGPTCDSVLDTMAGFKDKTYADIIAAANVTGTPTAAQAATSEGAAGCAIICKGGQNKNDGFHDCDAGKIATATFQKSMADGGTGCTGDFTADKKPKAVDGCNHLSTSGDS